MSKIAIGLPAFNEEKNITRSLNNIKEAIIDIVTNLLSQVEEEYDD